jgi:Matrixin
MNMRHLISALALIPAGCGSSTPTTPTPTPAPIVTPTPTPSPTTATVSGRVTATNGGQALDAVAVTIGPQTVTSDGGGAFSFVFPLFQGNQRVSLAGPNILTRSTTAAVNMTRTLPLDAIALSGGFDQRFYEQLVRNTYDDAKKMEPLRRWTQNPNIYLRTIDERGTVIDAKTLDSVEATLRLALPAWTSGKLAIAALERGTSTRLGVAGWITVQWSAEVITLPSGGNKCGDAVVGTNPGTINIYYRGEGHCRCPGLSEASPRMVSHELGHALGFWHTDNTRDVMYPTYQSNCDPQPSERERYHAAIAYSRPVGNRDPDDDSQTSVVLSLPRVTVH